MLTDVFFRRYEKRPMFNSVGPKESALFVQAYRIVNEDIWKYYSWEKKVDERVKAIWTSLHDRLTREIGITELSARHYSFQTEWMGKPITNAVSYDINLVVQAWMNAKCTDTMDPDVFVKRRLSFIELAFRERESQIDELNEKLPTELKQAALQDAIARAKHTGMRVLGSRSDGVKAQNELTNSMFTSQVHELNERFKQAGMPLNYHNGFIQITQDALVQAQIEQPFWDLVKEPKWKNVSTDMATAIDLRDTAGPDPSFYAGRALESTIKIISEEKNWSTGTEKGVGGYLNNLTSKTNGSFIAPWEHELMQRFFSDVRNDLAHGPGSKEMPKLTAQQTDHSIEFCMSWVKSLIARL